jgi:hypothetical protein
MYETNLDKIFVVDYFIYNPTNPTRKIFTHVIPSVSRKSAEQSTRDLEKGSKITIVKIQSFSVNYSGNSVEDSYAD